LAEAFERKGIHAPIFDCQRDTALIRTSEKPDFSLSFNRSIADPKGHFFWDYQPFPHLSILVDPSFYDLNIIRSPNSIISCVDHFDCRFLNMHGFTRTFFFPHAVERELQAEEDQERPYEIVLFGSCYDPDSLKAIWRAHLKDYESQLVELAIDIGLSNRATTFWEATALAIAQLGIDPTRLSLRTINSYVDNYMRGIDRLELVRAVRHAELHVFGGTCWREETPILGWSRYLGNMPNVTVHPAVPFPESLEILKRSKICLNSMPFFKNGTHERIFTGLAAGCLPMTTDNVWTHENFTDGKDILVYRPKFWNEIDERISFYLGNETERKVVAACGREKVMREHTWDNRVDLLLETMPPLIAEIEAKRKS
jgi:glycosyltransferase involved in cell wall biosynthesis